MILPHIPIPGQTPPFAPPVELDDAPVSEPLNETPQPVYH